MQIYLVGGAVRDEIMGRRSNDLDYTVVLEPHDYQDFGDPFKAMVYRLTGLGYKIFLETPQHFTVRAQTPDRKETADFVLAREEGPYTDGRRPDWVRPGTLEMDLGRRDFCFNAIAKDSEGNFIDPFNGRADIDNGVIRAVGSAYDRLSEDALRAVRALRFHVTTGFRIDRELELAMNTVSILDKVADNVSDERIMSELNKMFKFDSVRSISALYNRPALMAAMFIGDVNILATMKQRGFTK